MGAGIAETAAFAGIEVVVRELPEYLDSTRERLETSLDRAVKRGKCDAVDRDAALARITLTSELEDVADAELAIEAVPENVELGCARERGTQDLDHEGARRHRR
jgi:3-hydroxybutyryl-CoA dehydrogenase